MRKLIVLMVVAVLVACSDARPTLEDIRAKHGIETSVSVHQVYGQVKTSSHYYEALGMIYVFDHRAGRICFTVEGASENKAIDCRGKTL